MKIIKFVLLVGMMISIIGCSMNRLNEKNEEKQTREEVKQEMLDYVNEKYDMEFECKSINYKDWYNPGAEVMYAYPKGDTAESYAQTFLVKRFKYKEAYKFSDNYIGYLMEPEYQNKYSTIVKKHFPDVVGDMPRGFVDPSPSTMTTETTYEEFKKIHR